MTRTLNATTEVRLRPALAATLIMLTFLTGIGAGLGLARVTAAPVAEHPAIVATAGASTEMSAAAYNAAHQAAIVAVAGAATEMSAAAYAAAHQAVIDARSGSDMSAAAYSAAHRAAVEALAKSGTPSH